MSYSKNTDQCRQLSRMFDVGAKKNYGKHMIIESDSTCIIVRHNQ